MKAPIVLFVYARPEHTRKTVGALLSNFGVEEHDLIVFSDAAKTAEKASLVNEVRDYLVSVSGFRSVRIICQAKNLGLAGSVINGVTETLLRYDRIIVLEDDMVTSPYFLSYMNEALDKYEADERVISVHGYMYPVQGPLPETFFLRGADCWGWGTWRRGWKLFNADAGFLLDEILRCNLTKEFDYGGAYRYSRMLKQQVEGEIDSWAIRWHASAFLADKLTLYPGRSLVRNIGIDNSGTHCGDDERYDVLLDASPVSLDTVDVVLSERAYTQVKAFFKKAQSPFWVRVFSFLRKSSNYLLTRRVA